MKIFDYSKNPKKLLSPDIVAMLTQIHEHKAEYQLNRLNKIDLLYAMKRSLHRVRDIAI